MKEHPVESSSQIAAEILEAVRSGDVKLQEKILRRYENLLRLIARLHVESRLQRKFDASDLVQQTLMTACQAFPKFRGATEKEFVAWLKGILRNELRHLRRRFRAELELEDHLEEWLSGTSRSMAEMIRATGTTPSQAAAEREQEVLLADALEELPVDYREVIVLRNLEELPHEEVARRMGRSPGAVRMLWVRALAELRRALARRGGIAASGGPS